MMNYRFFRRYSAFGAVSCAALAAVLAPASVAAQSEDSAAGNADVIYVTAQRRAERSQDVPISITAHDADALERNAVQDLSDIVKLTPALRYDYQGGFAQPTIRGIGSAVVTSGSGSNVGVYIDGFFSPNPLQADFQLLSVESVEVLKGPQGTLFGRNATGGAILINTADPSPEPTAVLQASYERFDTQRYQGYATAGVNDTLAFDIAAIYESTDGYLRNVVTGDENVLEGDKWSVRAGVKVDLSDQASFLFRYTHADIDDPTTTATNAAVSTGGVIAPAGTILSAAAAFGAFVATDPREVSYTSPNTFTSETDAFQLRGNFDLGFAELTSYTQYRDEKAAHEEDFDASALPVFDLQFLTTDEIFTQELIFTSEVGDRLQWTAGFFYLWNKDRFNPVLASSGGAPLSLFTGSGTTTQSIAGFVDATYELVDNLFLTGGLRYSRDTVKDAFFIDGPLRVAFGLAPAEGRTDLVPLKDDRLTPRVVLRYQPTDNSSVYGSYTQGYKAAIYNVGGATTVPVAAEEIDAFEIGYKYASGPFSLDAAAYYYDYKNLQLASFDSQASIVKNASDSKIKGVEVQGRYQLTDDFEINAAAAWTDAEYKEFVDSPLSVQCLDFVACGLNFGLFPAGITTDASGFELLRAPEFTGNLGALYTADFAGGGLSLSGNLYYTSDFFFDSSNQFEEDGYALLNLRAEWTDSSNRFSFAVYGDNVTNAKYRTQVLPGQFAILQTWARPAIWGVSVTAKL